MICIIVFVFKSLKKPPPLEFAVRANRWSKMFFFSAGKWDVKGEAGYRFPGRKPLFAFVALFEIKSVQ
jgi:hypothetical protein